ncbi:hypothetical protein Nmel_011302, partial [Mimus melanotis]
FWFRSDFPCSLTLQNPFKNVYFSDILHREKMMLYSEGNK